MGRTMTGHGQKFERQKEAAIAALIHHQGNIEQAAHAVHVCGRTLRRWMQLPEFDAAYRQARQDIVRQAHARL
jgi:transposase-like protein